MSDTSDRSYKTHSKTETSETASSDAHPAIPDRWSHIITYEQLVLSSCVGIAQLWWHPYIHDLPKLLPFLFLYNMFSVTVSYPVFYLELGLGVITKKSCIDCWDIAPVARGIGIAATVTALFTALALSAAAAHSLALLVHSLHGFLPWLHCAAGAATACAARHRPFANGSDTPAQSFFFNFVADVDRGAGVGLGRPVWELAAYFVISWLVVYLISVKRVYSYSKLVLFKDTLVFFLLVSAGVGAARLDGAGRMFSRCDWSVLYSDVGIWSDALQYALVEMTVCQGSVTMLGSLCPPGRRLGALTTAALVLSKLASITSSLVLGAVHGALCEDYDSESVNLWGGASASLVLWADWAARAPGSQFWATLVFFTLFVAAVTSVALAVVTVLSVFSGRSLKKTSWAFLILICFLVALIGFLTLCTQFGLQILNTLLAWSVSRARAPAAALQAAAVTCLYGQKTFCEELFFQTGEYPWVYFRVCWAVAPVLIMTLFLADTTFWASDALGLVSLASAFLPAVFLLAFYLFFKCRVRNMVNEL